jgi:ferredoxin/flavodoxin---NADP+ reductase
VGDREKLVRQGWIEARLDARQTITDSLARFFFRVTGAIGFLPGQHAALGIREEGNLTQRNYSIVSSPSEMAVEFFIKRVDDDHFTGRLFGLRPGADVLIRSPAGTFLFDRESRRPHHLMVATATGIAPFVSMVRALAIEEKQGRRPGVQIGLLHGASYAHEFGYDGELGDLAAAHAWLTYMPTVSRPGENAGWTGKIGRVEHLIAQALDLVRWMPRDTTAYLCGHPGMISEGKKILDGLGFHQDQIRQEQS